VVLHVGDSPESAAGGISRVIRGHVARGLDGIRLETQPSFDPQGASFVQRQRPALGVLARLVRRGFVPPGSAILHVHVSKGFSHLREGSIGLLARCLGWRVVVTWHASSGLAASRISRASLALALRPASVVTVLSPSHANAVPAARDKVVVIPNDVPVPSEVLDMSAREPWVVFAGEVGPRKGADVLLRAWARVPEELRRTWSLHVHGRVTSELADAAAAARTADPSVHLHGLSPSAAVLDQLSRASVGVLPSRAEALPMFLLEAMASGCAVVGTEVGAVPELLRDGAGLVLPAGDEASLTAALVDLLRSPALRERTSRAGRARVLSTYSSDHVGRRWQDLYRGLAAVAR
jgi:glycosyltransferase involved in cell wall biosynthesis